MALSDTLSALPTKARRCRIEKLLAKVSPEDAVTLRNALHQTSLPPIVLTAALNKEYGPDTVSRHSVSDWRRKNLPTEVNGL